MADETKTVPGIYRQANNRQLVTDAALKCGCPTGEEAEIAKYLVDRFER